MSGNFLSDMQVKKGKDHFVINLDVKHFNPEELSVKISDEYVNICGKHKEREVSTVTTE